MHGLLSLPETRFAECQKEAYCPASGLMHRAAWRRGCGGAAGGAGRLASGPRAPGAGGGRAAGAAAHPPGGACSVCHCELCRWPQMTCHRCFSSSSIWSCQGQDVVSDSLQGHSGALSYIKLAASGKSLFPARCVMRSMFWLSLAGNACLCAVPDGPAITTHQQHGRGTRHSTTPHGSRRSSCHAAGGRAGSSSTRPATAACLHRQRAQPGRLCTSSSAVAGRTAERVVRGYSLLLPGTLLYECSCVQQQKMHLTRV